MPQKTKTNFATNAFVSNFSPDFVRNVLTLGTNEKLSSYLNKLNITIIWSSMFSVWRLEKKIQFIYIIIFIVGTALITNE